MNQADEAGLSRAELRALDARATAEFGVPGALLMENAGRQAAERTLATLRAQALAGRRGPLPWRILVLCGRGNNGGDGYVLARHVFNEGHAVECLSTCDAGALTGDAALNRGIVERMGLGVQRVANAGELAAALERMRGADALVDALLGTGATGAPRGESAALIEAANAVAGPLKVALDLPSGLDADTGTAPGACFRADLTVTFAARKQGFANPAAAEFLGRVVVADIGIALRVLRR